ncbi:MAG TPA: histidine phosphatase family protein [Kofleriaceae bacterium]|nr:histidine phosphatase family protein [Kofleriaceae bacterium]
MTRTLVLVRHGETAWNREGRFQGHLDIPLNEVGRSQARALRARLTAPNHAHLFDDAHTAVVTSDLKRAHETAEIAFGGGGRTLHVRRELREFCYGVFEGFTRTEIEARFPGVMAEWLRGEPHFAIEGGESRAAVHARTHAAVRGFLAEVAQPHVIVVAHGGVLRQLLLACFHDRSELGGLSFGNTAAHVVSVGPERWTYRGAL